jgi:hypothetical protein
MSPRCNAPHPFIDPLSPRHDFLLNPRRTSIRIAFDSDGSISCLAAHASMSLLSCGGIRSAITGSLPVAGRPFVGIIFFDINSTFPVDFRVGIT